MTVDVAAHIVKPADKVLQSWLFFLDYFHHVSLCFLHYTISLCLHFVNSNKTQILFC